MDQSAKHTFLKKEQTNKQKTGKYRRWFPIPLFLEKMQKKTYIQISNHSLCRGFYQIKKYQSLVNIYGTKRPLPYTLIMEIQWVPLNKREQV